jgi:ariadne-1
LDLYGGLEESWRKNVRKHFKKRGGYYKCNKYKEEELEKKNKLSDKDKAREALEKYNFYYTRYSNHKQSQKFEKKLRKDSEEKMKELQLLHKYSSWNDVDFVINAAEQLIECRGSLKFTYVFGYFLQNQKERNLFEFLQQDLEQVTEELSYLLEQPVVNFDRNKILNVTKSAGKRLEKLLSGLKDGLTKDLKNNENKN